jgi:hypothetical protein
MTNISKTTVLVLLTATLVALPALSRAGDADANMPATSEQAPPGKSKKHGVPFHGKLAAVDAQAMTLNVGTMVIHVAADTKITKAGQPATLADGVVGEPVSGAYLKAEDGQLNATMVRFGPKTEDKPKDKPEKKHKEPAEAGDKN